MSGSFNSIRRTFGSLALLMVGVLSTLGAMSLAHVGPAQAQSPRVSLDALSAQVGALRVQVADLQADNEALKAKTAPLNVSDRDLTISGVNVHIVNGMGSTTSFNGFGNLTIGYNATSTIRANVRTGSHNLILGDGNSYSSYGGLVAGKNNVISGSYASVIGVMGTQPAAPMPR